jgi:WD40 repeat protein
MCNGKLISGGDDSVFKVWNTQNFVCEHEITDHTDEVRQKAHLYPLSLHRVAQSHAVLCYCFLARL